MQHRVPLRVQHHRDMAVHFHSLAEIEPLASLRRHLRRLAAQHYELAERLESVGIAAAGVLLCTSLASRAEENYLAAVMRELPQATVSLDEAIKVSKREGKPISAEYDVEDGGLQISVYAKNGDQFSEVIVDPKSGSIIKTKPLTDPKEIREAEAESAAITKAKLPLEAALGAAVSANNGYRAVGVVPIINDDEPVATVTMIGGDGIKTVAEKLD
jgi:Peptidase propeptide and YPEB domain